MAKQKAPSAPNSSSSRPEGRSAAPPSLKLFRPNPNRAVFVTGLFDQDLVYRLTPEIIKLQHTSRDPITVYIDSPGGNVAVGATIMRLLRIPGLDSPFPCHVITVATSLAASAAAMLLCSGNYVIASPGSLIHFHGVRTYRQAPITKEAADDVAKDLKASNDASAVELVRRRTQQFFFRSVTMRSLFAEYRAKNPKAVTDKDCFVGIISERLSPLGLDVVRKAEGRYKRYDSLSTHVFNARGVKKQLALMKIADTPQREYKKLEAEMLKAIIAFEMPRKQVPGWSFASDGLARVNDDFILLNEYLEQHHNPSIEGFCETWKDFILDDAEKATIEALPSNERTAARVDKLAPVLLPLWLFFGSICHVLQESENPLKPEDAFWLGLVDEVLGTNLPTLRRIAERGPTAQQPKNRTAKDGAPESVTPEQKNS